MWVNPSVFDEKDHVYIQQWLAVDQFNSPLNFKVSLEKEEKSFGGDKGAEVYFDITFQNRSDFSFENVSIEYRMYIDEVGYSGARDGERCVGGSIKVGSIPSGDRKSVVTEVEKLIEEHKTIIEESREYDAYGFAYTSRVSKKKKFREDKVRGILLRIVGPSIDGVASIKEIEYPNGFSDDVRWVEDPK
jgi:hypothetical protein